MMDYGPFNSCAGTFTLTKKEIIQESLGHKQGSQSRPNCTHIRDHVIGSIFPNRTFSVSTRRSHNGDAYIAHRARLIFNDVASLQEAT